MGDTRAKGAPAAQAQLFDHLPVRSTAPVGPISNYVCGPFTDWDTSRERLESLGPAAPLSPDLQTKGPLHSAHARVGVRKPTEVVSTHDSVTDIDPAVTETNNQGYQYSQNETANNNMYASWQDYNVMNSLHTPHYESDDSWTEQDEENKWRCDQQYELSAFIERAGQVTMTTKLLIPHHRRELHAMAHLSSLSHMSLGTGREKHMLLSKCRIAVPAGERLSDGTHDVTAEYPATLIPES